ncbi:MAG: hypothetical protein M0000_01430 [Actinomycetota bacterium]|nr:hypothetical protein [Actinomycetota bacterium]MDA8210225.1 hypothetical protein [Actinomycetota bacterium]
MPSLAVVPTPNAVCKYASLDVKNEQANHPVLGDRSITGWLAAACGEMAAVGIFPRYRATARQCSTLSVRDSFPESRSAHQIGSAVDDQTVPAFPPNLTSLYIIVEGAQP